MEKILFSLSKSKFRSSFYLKQKDIDYIKTKSLDVTKAHAYDFINQRLAPKLILNDGKQTPMKGHPVFIAMHATATCCRNCLEKWHKIKKGHELDQIEKDYIANIIMQWINNQIKESSYEKD